MKTLVISLLRAGDILMQKPLFEALKKQDSAREIHLLINDEIAWIVPLVTCVDKIHFFPRVTLQRLMGEASHQLTRAPQELHNFLNILKAENYSEVYNFTHTRLSAFIAEEIGAGVTKGLHSNGQKFLGIDNNWMKLFNERFSMPVDFSFHYGEILSLAMGLSSSEDISEMPRRKYKRIFLQAYTSDQKKNWHVLSFRQLLDRLYQSYPDLQYKVLASPKEKEKLLNYFEEEEICTWTLSEISSELCESDILVTGDTAVMHIAAQKSSQVVELALGSSDPWRTGPLGEGHIVLQSKVNCYPCVHSRPCKQISHLCGESIGAGFVASVIEALLTHGEIPTANHNIEVYKTHKDENIGWWIERLGDGKGGYKLMNKILWRFLEREDFSMGKSVAAYFLKRSLPAFERTQAELKEKMFELQSEFEALIQKLGNGHVTMVDIQKTRRDLSSIRPSAEISEWLWAFQDLAQLPFATPLHFLSAYQDRLEQLKAVVYKREQLIEKLKTGDSHEPGSGKISEDSFAET